MGKGKIAFIIFILSCISYIQGRPPANDFPLTRTLVEGQINRYRINYTVNNSDQGMVCSETGYLIEKVVRKGGYTALEYTYTTENIIFSDERDVTLNKTPLISSYLVDSNQRLYSCNQVVDPSPFLMLVVLEGAGGKTLGANMDQILANKPAENYKVYNLPPKDWKSPKLWDLDLLSIKNTKPIPLQPPRNTTFNYSVHSVEYREGRYIGAADFAEPKGFIGKILKRDHSVVNGNLNLDYGKGNPYLVGIAMSYPYLLRGVQVCKALVESPLGKKLSSSKIYTHVSISKQ